jgi:deazaflavin-dependent oxidoreductase (nitroreductase family)
MAHDRIRSINKHILNPLMRTVAGRPLFPVGVVYHRGRQSGKEYATPVIPWPVAGGFVIALTYGPKVDWYRNVLAAGTCKLRWHGRRYELTQPTPLARAQGLASYPPPFRQILGTLGTRDFVWMQSRPAAG